MEWKSTYKQFQEAASKRHIEYLKAYFDHDEGVANEIVHRHRMISPEEVYQARTSYHYFKSIFDQKVKLEAARKHSYFHIDIPANRSSFLAQAVDSCSYDNLFKKESDTFKELEESIPISKPIVDMRNLLNSILQEENNEGTWYLVINSRQLLLEKNDQCVNFYQYLAKSISEKAEKACKFKQPALSQHLQSKAIELLHDCIINFSNRIAEIIQNRIAKYVERKIHKIALRFIKQVRIPRIPHQSTQKPRMILASKVTPKDGKEADPLTAPFIQLISKFSSSTLLKSFLWTKTNMNYYYLSKVQSLH